MVQISKADLAKMKEDQTKMKQLRGIISGHSQVRSRLLGTFVHYGGTFVHMRRYVHIFKEITK